MPVAQPEVELNRNVLGVVHVTHSDEPRVLANCVDLQSILVAREAKKSLDSLLMNGALGSPFDVDFIMPVLDTEEKG
jgi:hypothetical protein